LHSLHVGVSRETVEGVHVGTIEILKFEQRCKNALDWSLDW